MSRARANSKTKKADKRPEPSASLGLAENFPSGSLEHILLALSMLEDSYGHEAAGDDYATGEPLDGLILTLLSQNTNDRNRDVAYEALRSEYPSWEDVAAASAEDIARRIKPAGLGDIKSSRMKDILAVIKSDFGGCTLVAMRDWNAVEAREYLSGLHGIGPKTVACVLAFDLGLPAFPVDTHVARVSRRLGWAAPKASPEKIQEFLEAIVPPERHAGGHLNMIEHGRKICHARGPECGGCVLRDICPKISEG
jgi:endonuclease-3